MTSVQMSQEHYTTVLARYCRERPEIVAAYLFGSQAKGTATVTSDVDVALLLDADFDLHANYMYRLEQMTVLEMQFHKPVDVVILNQASLELKNQVLRYGHLVYEANHQARVDFEVQTHQAYFDFQPYRDTYHQKLLSRIREGTFANQYHGHRDPLGDARRALERFERAARGHV